MSLANTLSVLLDFKSDLSGLTKFTEGLRSRLTLVKELNDKMANGAAAVNTAIAAGAAFFAVGALKEYTGEALQSREAQAKLGQALEQTKQNSSAYRAELAEQASALQEVTGIEDEVIAGVQRQLVFGGAQKKDIAQLTRLTLDFAAAKEVDAVGAAKAVGRALQGEGDELKRYGVEIDETKDKLPALLEGLGKFKGQASTAFSSLPEGLREFRIASKDAQQSAGEAVIAISNPLLQGIAEGLRGVSGRLHDVEEHGSLVRDVLTGAASALGTFVGANLDRLLILAGMLATLKAGSYGLSEALKVVTSGFLAVTSVDLLPLLANMQAMSKEIGILQVVTMGGWTAKFAVGLAAVGVGLAAFAAGSMLINSIEQAQLGRLDREERIRESIAGQTKSLQQQVGLVKNAADVATARAALEADIKAKEAKFDALPRQGRNRKIAQDFQGEAALLLEGIAINKRNIELLDNPDFVGKTFTKNLAPDSKKTIAANRELDFALAEARRKELETQVLEGNKIYLATQEREKQAKAERELFELETQAKAAEASGNIKLLEQLQLQITEKQLIASLDFKNRDLIAARLAEEKKLSDQKKADAEAERALAAQLGDIAIRRADLDADRYTSAEEKQRTRLKLLAEENRLIDARIEKLEKELVLNPDPQIREKIDGLRKQRADNRRDEVTSQPQTAGQAIVSTTVGMQDRIGGEAEQVANAWQSTAETMRTSMGGAFADMILKSESFSQAAVGFGQAVAVGFIQSGAQMLADWIMNHIVMEGVKAAFTATDVGLHATGEATKTGISLAGAVARKAIGLGETIFHGIQWVIRTVAHLIGETTNTGITLAQQAIRLPAIMVETGAYLAKAAIGALSAMASIPYVGPILAIAAMGAIVAAGAKVIGGFREHGGPVQAGQSYVVGERRAEIFTPDQDGYIYPSIGAGIAALSDNVTAGMTAPAAADDQGAGGGGGGGGQLDIESLMDIIAQRISVIVPTGSREVSRIARHSRAAGDVVRIVQEAYPEISQRGPSSKSRY